MQNQDTETLFKKKVSISVGILVFILVTMGIGIARYIVNGSPPSVFMRNIFTVYITPIVYAINLLIFAGIGKDKGKDNRIMSFIFGILTIVLSGLLILERALKISGYIEGLITDITNIPADLIYIVNTVLDSVRFAFVIIVIVFSISSIVNSVAIIKENVPSSQATATRPTTTAPISSPTKATQPPKSSGSQAQFCSSCGAAVEAGAVFCNKCGAKV